jgi:hypothetical protein
MLRTGSMVARLERPVKNFNKFKNLALDARGRSVAAVVAPRLLQTVHDSKMMADLAVLAALNPNALRRNDFEDRQPELPSDRTSVVGRLTRSVHLQSQRCEAFATCYFC